MTMPSKAEVTAQMQVELGTGQDTYLPARQLAQWQKAGTIPTLPAEQDQTQLLRMYMALKTIMAGKGTSRISAAQFSGYVRTIILGEEEPVYTGTRAVRLSRTQAFEDMMTEAEN